MRVDKKINVNRLASKLKEGESKAYQDLFDNFGPKLYLFSFRYLQNKEEAEEIVQETFIKIWENRGQIKEDMALDRYFIKIAKHLIFNKTRKKVREYALKQGYANQKQQVDESTEKNIIYENLVQFENKLLEKLPSRRRQILTLKKSGLSNTEIAQTLKISKSTVENSINKALKNLQPYLKSKELFVLLALFFKLFK